MTTTPPTIDLRRGGVLFAACVLSMGFLSGCGGSDDTARSQVATAQSASPGGDASASEQTVAPSRSVLETYIDDMQKYADCLRSNGLPDLADPNQFGQILVTQETAPDPAVAHQAQLACEKLAIPMPSEVKALIDNADASALTDAQKHVYAQYATCMQDNGAADFPDPLPNGLPGEAPWDQTSAGAQRASSSCASIIGDPVVEGPGVG
ncbi:hypothetical protein [Nocardioides sp. W7]|uniref:hypothetical protein n=1 Tax=Nocardioides sp. W7 TaxID=2931390 RepID=UPI001FD08227|nr:hypothetical protein [Nocardioides sp. W7]